MSIWGLLRWLSAQGRQRSNASDALKRFLAADDLDDLLRVASALPGLAPDDAAVVRRIIENWRPQQAVANLLFHPHLVPSDVRVAAILRAMNECGQPYLKLAATVGLASVEPRDIAPGDAAVIRSLLLKLIEADDSILSSRASVSIDSWLDASSSTAVCRLLNHANETVAHNLLAWLIRHVDPVELRSLLEASELPPASMRRAIRDVGEYRACLEAGASFTRASSYFFSYIPNLSEFPDNSREESRTV
jgi:hypothetical protein